MMERHPLLRIARVVLHPWCIGPILCAAVIWGAWSYFFGPNGDLHRLKLRLLMDGAAPSHRFDAGSNHAGVNLNELNLKGSFFPMVGLRKARFAKSNLDRAVFEGCNLAGADLSGASARQAKLVMCRLEGADLRDCDLSDADLSGSSFKLALLGGAKLKGANLAHADLSGALGLPIAELRGTLNWQLAIYDDGTAASIADAFQKAGLSVPSFASWDAWLLEQKRLAVGHEAPHTSTPQ